MPLTWRWPGSPPLPSTADGPDKLMNLDEIEEKISDKRLKFPGLKVLGLVVFSFASVLRKTQKSVQSRELFPGSSDVDHVVIA